MSNRAKTIFIVEGDNEKNEFFSLIINLFPELDIKSNDVMVFGTNIYELYKKIVDEYGADWDTLDDIDLPFVISKMKNLDECLRKREFKNIYLIFDLEHQDSFYDDEKIHKLIKIFDDPTNNGKLYINYPMLESYLDFDSNPYLYKNIQCSTLVKGKLYKNSVKSKSSIVKIFSLFNKINKSCPLIKDTIFTLKADEINVDKLIKLGFSKNDAYKYNYMLEFIKCYGSISFFEIAHQSFINIIKENIIKSYVMLKYGLKNEIDDDINCTKKIYNSIRDRMEDILLYQIDSINHFDLIWILSTCLLLIPDYNYNLLSK